MPLRNIDAMHVKILVPKAGQSESAVEVSEKDLRFVRVVIRKDEVIDTVAIKICDAGAAKLERLGFVSDEARLFGDVDKARPELAMDCREVRYEEQKQKGMHHQS